MHVLVLFCFQGFEGPGRHLDISVLFLTRIPNIHALNLLLQSAKVNLKLHVQDNRREWVEKEVPVPFMSPHDVLRVVWGFGWKQWLVSVLGLDGVAGLQSYWDNARETDWGRAHSGMAEGTDTSKRVFLHLFHDGVKSYTNQELQVWSWRSATATGMPMD